MTEKNHLRLIVGANLLLIALACANICAHFSQPGFLLLSASVANAADFAFNALLVPFMAIVIYFLVVNDLRVRRGEAKICAAEMDTLTMNALLLFVPFWLPGSACAPPLLALLQLAGDVVVIYRCLRTFLPPRPIPPGPSCPGGATHQRQSQLPASCRRLRAAACRHPHLHPGATRLQRPHNDQRADPRHRWRALPAAGAAYPAHPVAVLRAQQIATCQQRPPSRARHYLRGHAAAVQPAHHHRESGLYLLLPADEPAAVRRASAWPPPPAQRTNGGGIA